MKILLIAGGWSGEREVSLSGARKIHAALEQSGHEVTFFDLADQFDSLVTEAEQHDFAFINLHGSPGEDGLPQAMLEMAGCPYQGADPRSSFLALNKAAAKQVFRKAGLRMPKGVFLTRQPDANWQPELNYPLFVKPNTGGSSLGMSIVKTPENLAAALDKAFNVDKEVLVEEALKGFEMTCTILDDTALPTILIKPKLSDEFFDYESKYVSGGAEEICPAPVDDALNTEIQKMALEAHAALRLRGYSRADFMVCDGTPYLLEVNTLPGMTPTSLVPQSAAAAGLDFPALIERLIELGLRDCSSGKNRVTAKV